MKNEIQINKYWWNKLAILFIFFIFLTFYELLKKNGEY